MSTYDDLIMGFKALLFCPDEKLVRVISQVFSEVDFAVEPVNDPFTAVKKLMAQRYDAVVVNCDNEQNSSLLFRSARNSSFNQNSLAIAVVEGQAGVAKAYRIGANLVLTKPINVEQSKGTLRVARGLLRRGDASSAAKPPVSGMAASPQAAAVPKQPETRSTSVEPSPAHASPVAFAAPVAAQPAQTLPPTPSPTMSASAKTEVEDATVPEPVELSLVEEIPDATSVPATQPPSASQIDSSTDLQPTAKDAAAASGKVADDYSQEAESAKPAEVFTPVHKFTPQSGGAAAAPAPAKEAGKLEEKVAAAPKPDVDEYEDCTGSAPVHERQNSPVKESAAPAPTFAALGVQDAEGSGSRRKILLLAIAAVILAIVGYLCWSEFSGSQSHSSAPTPHPVAAIPQPPSAASNQATLPNSAPIAPPAATDRASVLTPASGETSSHVSQPSSRTSAERITLNLEPPAKQSAPLVVKQAASAPKAQPAAEDATTQPPSPLAVTSPDGASPSLALTEENVSKPTLARVRVSQGVSQGLLIKRVQPKYPSNALASHIQGNVQIEATITNQGLVANPKVLSGDPILAAAALEAVRQWRYKPYFLDGQPVEMQTQITITFKAN